MSIKNVTMRDIAKEIGISPSAVSLGLSNSPRISAEMKATIKTTARKLGYKPNATISEVLSKIRTNNSSNSGETIAIFNVKRTKQIKNSTLETYLNGAISQAKRMGYSPLYIDLHSIETEPQKISTMLKARGVRGGVITGHYHKKTLTSRVLKVIKNIELVAIGVKGKSPIRTSVVLDRFQYTYMFTRKISKLGYKRIGFVIERFADINEEGKLVGGYLRAQLDDIENSMIPFFWNNRSDNIASLNKYIRKNKLDALLSYSTAISEVLEKSVSKIAKVKIFHADNCAFKNNEFGGIINRAQVGTEGVRILSEILRRNSPRKKNSSPQIHSITPRWK